MWPNSPASEQTPGAILHKALSAPILPRVSARGECQFGTVCDEFPEKKQTFAARKVERAVERYPEAMHRRDAQQAIAAISVFDQCRVRVQTKLEKVAGPNPPRSVYG